jgi:hypothetical protein
LEYVVNDDSCSKYVDIRLLVQYKISLKTLAPYQTKNVEYQSLKYICTSYGWRKIKQEDEDVKSGNYYRYGGKPMLDALEIKGLTPTENHNRASM